MTDPLMQSLKWFISAAMIASTVGFLSYVLIRWTCEKSPEGYLFIFSAIAILAGGLLLIGGSATDRLIYGVVSLCVWMLATFAERVAQPSQESWIETFFKLVVGTVCSALLSFVFLCCIDGFIPHASLSAQDEVWFFNGFLLGALNAPATISIFLWVWKTLQRRPGYDRHLYRGEDPV